MPYAYAPAHVADKTLTAKTALEGEHKHVTVLFCDLVDSTPLAERLGPEGMHGLLDEFFELALAEVQRYEGMMNQFLGDGFMALFGAPVAHEDHARRAVLAALAIDKSLREQRAEPDRAGSEIVVRMGLNTGPVVVGKIGNNLRMDYTAIGDTTNLAARLQQIAEAGAILISHATQLHSGPGILVESLGPLRVKGRSEPVKVFKVVGQDTSQPPLRGLGDRPLSRFVGREREWRLLDDLLDQVERGQGQVVGLVGDPGVGKSRLVYEFGNRVKSRGVQVLEGRCLSYGANVPYVPVLDVLRSLCGIAISDPGKVIDEKLNLTLHDLGVPREFHTRYLLQLLGGTARDAPLDSVSPEKIKLRTFEALRQLSLAVCRCRPVLLVVEDIHWIDKTSEAYLDFLTESLASARVILLCTYRPGYSPPWIERSYATQIALRPLSKSESLSVVGSMAERALLSESIAGLILDKAEGNPFFLEELARVVLEHADRSVVQGVPDTIQDVLMARIDLLPDVLKRLLQTASVLGREFPPSLLDAICEDPGPQDERLHSLARAEFLYERNQADGPVYVFKHALTQEVAYESLLLSRRGRLHLAAAQALETLYAGRIEDVFDRLAYHYSRTVQSEKAVEYLTLCAERMSRWYAHDEAVRTLREALVHVERLPAERRERTYLNLVLQQALSLYLLGRLQEALELLLAQRDRLERLGESALAGPYYFWLAHTYSIGGERSQAVASAERALVEAERCGDRATLGKTWYVLAVEDFWRSQPDSGVAHAQTAVTLLQDKNEQYWLGIAYWVLGYHQTVLGDFDVALGTLAQARAVGEALGDPRVQSYAAWTTGWNLAMRGEGPAAVDSCIQSVEHAKDPVTRAVCRGVLGYAYLEQGHVAEAIPLLEEAVHHFARFQTHQLELYLASYLGAACVRAGDLVRGQELATRALEGAQRFLHAFGSGWAHRVLGEIEQRRSAAAGARVHYEKALEIFASIPAPLEVGRTHLALAELAQNEARISDAKGHLESARQVFTALRVPVHLDRMKRISRGILD
jgi:class 3 adenylate cyclase/tetratricopeptide (TPR) repeat protein